MIACMYGHTYIKSMDQPGKVANPARGQLNRENEYSLSAFAPKNLVSRDEILWLNVSLSRSYAFLARLIIRNIYR